MAAEAEAAVISGMEVMAERLHPALHISAAEEAAVISGVEVMAVTAEEEAADIMGLVGVPLFPLLPLSMEQAAAESQLKP